MVRSLADHRRCEEINNTVTNGLRISSSPFQSVLSQNNGCRSSPYEYALFPVEEQSLVAVNRSRTELVSCSEEETNLVAVNQSRTEPWSVAVKKNRV